jgi:hypothetical protein
VRPSAASSTDPSGPSKDQLSRHGRVLAPHRLVGGSDEIPVDDDNRGRFIGARDDYARTDDTIRQVRDHAMRGLQASDLPDPMDPDDAQHPWRWPVGWMKAAWLRGVRDLLTWILGEHPTSPLCRRTVGMPTAYDLTYEDAAADDVVTQGRPGGLPVDPSTYPPPQYGEGIQATIRWLRGEDTTPPITNEGCSPYVSDRHRAGQDGSC